MFYAVNLRQDAEAAPWHGSIAPGGVLHQKVTADRTYQQFVRGLTDATASPGIG